MYWGGGVSKEIMRTWSQDVLGSGCPVKIEQLA